jgi:ssDNA-binding Zn-finger/Zn-ribbon topoisomerase 1
MPRPKMYIPPYERDNLDRALRRIGSPSYASYLRSGLWETSRRRLVRTACEDCGSGAGLVLHHMTYARLGEERIEDVCTLCPACHLAAHRAAGRGGTLYPENVMARRAARPAREKKIGALEVSCPACGALPTHHCRLPSGHVRGREHQERTRKLDAQNKGRGARRRARAQRKKARRSKMSVEQQRRIQAVRDSEFPLDALRELDEQMTQALRRDSSV